MSIKMIQFCFIPGLMFGFEWQYDEGFMVIDLGIIRVIVDYWGIEIPDQQEDKPS